MEITIPTSLKEIPLSQLVKWEQSAKMEDDLLFIFCGIENPDKISSKDYKELVQLLTDVINSEVNFHKTFTYKGIDFGFIPNLDVIPTNEYIDIDEYIKEPKDWHKALSVMYRPLIKRKRNWFRKCSHDLYDILDYKGTNDFLIDAPAEYYLGAMVFFYNLGNELLSVTLDYSREVEKALTKNQVSTASGDGMLV